MRLLSFASVLSILYTLPLAFSAPAETSATTTLLSAPRISSTFPLQTSSTTPSVSTYLVEEDKNVPAATMLSVYLRLGKTITDFVPAPTGSNGLAERWYIVTYYSCVTFGEDDVHCGYHTPVRPGVGPDGSYFDAGERREVWFVGLAVGMAVAIVGAMIM